MNMKKYPFLVTWVLAVLAAGAGAFSAHAQCNVYLTEGQQVIDGFGFSTAWCGTLSTAKNQSLYGTLGMSLMRIQIVNDVAGATDGAWNYEQADTAAAHSYGAKVFGTDWYGPSGWDDTNTYLLPQYYGANAVFLAQCAQYTHLDWVSPANEPDYGWQFWTTNGFVQWTTTYGASVGVPLMEPESFQFAEPYSQTIVDNPNIPNSIMPIAGGHSYGVTASVHAAELAAGKRVWMTEVSEGNGQDLVSGEAVPIAQQISQYMNAQFNAYLWWWVYDTDTNANLVEESGKIHKNGYAIGQFAKWIRPGSTRVTADFTPQANVNVTAYNAYGNGGVVIVAVNANNNSVSQAFTIHNGNATLLEGYQTSTNDSMTDMGAFAVTGGSFTVTLPAQSITTFVQTNTLPANLPPTWAAQDFGAVGMAGSTTYTNTVGTNGVFTMTASGNDIWGTADAFRFVYGTNVGSGMILARVSAEQSANALAKAGVMIRSSLASNAPNALVALTPAGVTFQYRTSTGGGTSSNLVSGLSAPCWVELAQSGSTFTGYYSPDGTTWTQVGTATISMGAMEYPGLAFCNNGNTGLGMATFDNVSTPSWPTAPPPAPTGLTATAGVERVTLTWQEGGYATNYTVQRALTNGGPYATIAKVVGPRFVDTDLPGGTTNYYQVNAVNTAGPSAYSAPASATPTANVLAPWVAQDVGAVNLPGSENFANGAFTIYASGADIQDTADACRFVYVTTNGANFTMTARVVAEPNINAWSKAGVMIRDSVNAGAANAFIALTPGNGVTWQARTSDGGTTSDNNTTGLSAPYWVKLARSGNTFTGYRSPDGVNWTAQGSATIAMSGTVYAGLAVTAHTTALLCAPTFDNVNAPGFMPPSASVPTSLAATGGVEQVSLSWQAAANANSYNVYRSTTNGGPYTLVTNVATTSYADLRLPGSGTTYYYVVTGVNSLAGESDNSAPASAKTTVTVPAPWTPQDIGAPGVWGGATFSNGVFTVSGSGADIWNTADAFRFVYVTTNSVNFTMIARVVAVPNVNAWSKAGIMIRDSLGAGAANALIAVTPGNGVTFQYRLSDGGNCNNTTGSGSAPDWVKLVGSGGTYTGYSSPDGVNWTLVGSTTLTNITKAYIGLAVTSHNNSSLCAATFDNVIAPGLAPAPLVVSGSAASTSQISLKWNALLTAAGYAVARSLTSGGPYTAVTNGVTGTNYLDSGLNGGTMYYYAVSTVASGYAITGAPVGVATGSPTLGSLVHRYSFSEAGGTNTADSVGGPVWHGTLPNGGSFSGSGQLTLSATASQYVSLPTGVAGGLSNFTALAWVNLNTVANGSRIFDFGNNTNTTLYVTAQNATTTNLYFAITTNGYGAEQPIFGNFPLSTGVWHQVALTLTGGTGTLYLDGVAVGTTNGLTLNPVSLGTTTNNYLGKAQSAANPYFDGQFEEFRIYNTALTPAEVAAMYALGSGVLLSTNSPVVGVVTTPTNLTLIWPLVSASFTLQTSTNLAGGAWVNVTSPAPEIGGTNYQILLPATNAAQFFRLSQ